MKIYVDMDDVLCETAIALCDIARREFGRSVDYRDVTDFDLQKMFSLSDADMERFRIFSHTNDALLSFSKTPGAIDGVKSLVASGHHVDIVTGRPASSHAGTEGWLEAAGLDDIAVTYVDKYNRSGIFEHAKDDPPTVSFEDLERRGYNVVIDDSPLALERLAKWSGSLVLVFDRPWNKAFDLAPNMRRVFNWQETLARIEEALG